MSHVPKLASICCLALLLARCGPPATNHTSAESGQVASTDPQTRANEPAPTALKVEDAGFIPSGWMGDAAKGQFVKPEVLSCERPHSLPSCPKIEYKAGPMRWAAISWQYPESNWGDLAGKDLPNRGFRQVSIWARAFADGSGLFPKVQCKRAARPIRRNITKVLRGRRGIS